MNLHCGKRLMNDLCVKENYSINGTGIGAAHAIVHYCIDRSTGFRFKTREEARGFQLKALSLRDVDLVSVWLIAPISTRTYAALWSVDAAIYQLHQYIEEANV